MMKGQKDPSGLMVVPMMVIIRFNGSETPLKDKVNSLKFLIGKYLLRSIDFYTMN